MTLANVNRFTKFFHRKVPGEEYSNKNFHLIWNVLLHYIVKFEHSKMWTA